MRGALALVAARAAAELFRGRNGAEGCESGDRRGGAGSAAARPPGAGPAPEPERKRGRPKGSRNRRSEELIRWVLSKHRHPLAVLAETYDRATDELASELACSALAAKALQVRCAVEALPYFESKKPVSLQVDARSIQLTVGQWEGSGGPDLPPWERLAGLIEGERADDDEGGK